MAERKNPTVSDVMKEASKYIHLPENLALIEKAASYASENMQACSVRVASHILYTL